MRLSDCDKLAVRPLNGHWYRALRLKYWETRLSTAPSQTRESRFSAASPGEPGHRILYLGENHQIVMYEVGALFGEPGLPIADPKGSWVIMSFHVVLDHVADLSERAQQEIIGTTHQELTGDWTNDLGRSPTQELGAALYAVPNLEGFLFASSKQKGRNLVVFPDKVGPRSAIGFQNELTGELELLN